MKRTLTLIAALVMLTGCATPETSQEAERASRTFEGFDVED